MKKNQNEYKSVENYLLFQELSSDSLGVNYRAGVVEREERRVEKHTLLTEVYPFLSGNPNVWKRINILLEGVKKSNIPKLYSPERIVQVGDKYYLEYPFMKSRTFEQVLDDSTKKDMPINFDLAFSIAFAAADLIDIGSSIVVSGEKSFHGFLTPDNIIIDYDGKISLKNYGIFPYLSREAEVIAEMEKKYGAWVAPEFLRREKLVCQTDIYHLGYITYRILTGKYFSFAQGEDFEAKFASISFIQHIPSSDKGFLTDIQTFFKKTLHPVPAKRFANIKEFKDFISNKFHIEELSSVTFNLAYFMNSLYGESAENENEVLENELAYTLPEEKKEEESETGRKTGDGLVEEILTGLDAQKKSRKKILIPLVALIAIIVGASAFIIISQQKQLKQQQVQEQSAEEMKHNVEKLKADLEAEYQKRLKNIEQKATTTEDEKKAQEDEIKKLREWQKEETRKALEKQQMEETRLNKLKADEEERKRQEEEQETLRKQEEEKVRETEKKQKQEEQRKELKKVEDIKEGQLIALVDVTQKPVKIKGKNPEFSPITQRKYKGSAMEVRTVLLIDETGSVINVKMLSQTPGDLEDKITRAIKRWKYEPAKKGEVKVKVWLPVNFQINF